METVMMMTTNDKTTIMKPSLIHYNSLFPTVDGVGRRQMMTMMTETEWMMMMMMVMGKCLVTFPKHGNVTFMSPSILSIFH